MAASKKVVFIAWFSAFILMMMAILSFAQETLLLKDKVIQAIIDEVSGELAWQNEWLLAPFERNRPQSEYTGHFWESDFMVQKAKAYGFQDVHIEVFHPKGETQWDGEKGKLWLVEPEKKLLADYSQITASLARGSLSTSVTAELIFAGGGNSPQDYKDIRVEGKIVLVTGELSQAHALAVVERGARGVVGYNPDPTTKYPDMVPWQSLREESVRRSKNPSFGFVLSPRIGNYLVELLKGGKKLVVQAETEARLYPKKLEVVTALIPGAELRNQEFLFVAHLYEGIAKQGANDNYSGCVCELEVGRALIKLQKEGKIPPLRRSIRFLWVPEMEGTVAYLERHPDEKRKMMAAINMDMVGEGLEKCHSIFRVSRTPHSLPHFINDLVQEIAELTLKLNNDGTAIYAGNVYGQFSNKIVAPSGSRDVFNLDVIGYDSGSDHTILDEGAVRIPCVYFECWPDDFYHTNMDTPDKTDPTQLKRVAFIAAASAAAFACAMPQDFLNIATETFARSEGRILEDLKKGTTLITHSNPEKLYESYRNATVHLKQGYLREIENLESLRFYSENDQHVIDYMNDLVTSFTKKEIEDQDKLKQNYEFLCRRYQQLPKKYEMTKEEIEMSQIIPERSGKDLKRVQIPPSNTVLKIDHGPYEAMNFVNGRRSILDLAHALYSEFGIVEAKDMHEFIMAHIKAGNLRIRSKSGTGGRP